MSLQAFVSLCVEAFRKLDPGQAHRIVVTLLAVVGVGNELAQALRWIRDDTTRLRRATEQACTSKRASIEFSARYSVSNGRKEAAPALKRLGTAFVCEV